MDWIWQFIKDNVTLSVVIAFLGLLITIGGFRLARKKFQFDKSDFENKKSKFIVYLEKGYRILIPNTDNRLILLNVRITNKSTTKTSILASLRIWYFSEEQKKFEVEVEFEPELFHPEYHQSLTKLPKEIRLEEKEIKSGWCIFRFPDNLLDKRIDRYDLILKDSFEHESIVNINLLKQIVYENHNQ